MAGLVAPTAPILHRPRGVVRTRINVTTDASGDATLDVVGAGYGRLVGVLYDGGLDASANITIRDTRTGAVLVSYTTGTEGSPVFFRPTSVITDVAGDAITAADTAPNVNRDMYVFGNVSVSVSSGGNEETCKIALIIDEVGLGELALTV